MRKLKGLALITARAECSEEHDEYELRVLKMDYFEFDRKAAQSVTIVFKDMDEE